MANLIFASEYVSKNTGAQMWHVYATRDGKKVANTVNGEATVKNEFYFYEPLKALRFAFLLRKRLEGSFSIPKGVYNKLMAAIKAAKPAPAPEAEQGESAPVPEEAQPEQQEQPAPKAGDAPAAELSPEAEAVSTHRALIKQYNEMREKHPDCILLFRNGDFYTAMNEDAEVVADVCGLVVTRVDEIFHYNKPVVYTAFPVHALDTYLPKLVRAGKRVAICDGLPEPQPEKKSRKRSTKKAENK